MVGSQITVKMCRGDQSPWGFRLQGGKDWGSPLVVSKVNPGSLADQGGLQIGDLIISIQSRNADGMLHKDAQDTIVKAGNNLELQVQRGGTTTWKPQVSAVGSLPRQTSKISDEPALVTKTSLAKNPAQESTPIGSGHNVAPKPFAAPAPPVLVHKQFNSPLNIYSMKSIQEAIQAHSEVIAPGVTGINFMKPDAPVNKESAVYRAIIEEETKQKGEYQHHVHVDNTETDQTPTLQSHAFRKIQQSLVEEDRRPGNPAAPSSPRSALPAHPLNKPSKPAGEGTNTCADCGRLIVGVFCRVKDKNLHAECFKCATCGTSLKNIGYFNVNDKLYCDVHAKQAAKMGLPPSSNYEPITIRPGVQMPTNGTLSPMSSPRITIPVQTGSHSPQSSGMLSPSIVSAMPWHSPVGVHHVTAPHSPSKIASVPPPVAPKPKYRPVSSPSSLYQSHPHPYTGSATDAHRQAPGTSYYSSSQTSVSQQQQQQQHQHQHQHQHIGQATTTTTTPGPGQSSIPGSRPAPRRGRGQLKQQGSPGTRVPVCSSCGSPIRGPFVVALGKSWCPEHFVCGNATCKRNLEDVGFVEEQGKLYCENCFESYLAPICSKCNIRIKGDTLMALERQWHPECFICSYCKKPFGNSSFYLEDGSPYCEKDWNDLFTTKCVGCGFAIEAGDRWVEALNNNYHSQCFKCTVCSKNLEGQSFYAKGGRPYCKSHAR